MSLYLERSAYDAQTRGAMLAALSPRARYAVKLYFRCQLFKEIALPEEGGVMDQSEMAVSMLDAVHSCVVQFHNNEMDKAARPKPSPNFSGVDSRMTENVHIGSNYSRSKTG